MAATLASVIRGAQATTCRAFGATVGDGDVIDLPGFETDSTFETFQEKARAYPRGREEDPVIVKLRMNEQLTPEDVSTLERMLIESGVGSADDIRAAVAQSQQLGLFVRSLVGFGREAAKRAFSGFLAGGTMTADQIHFVDLVVNYLTERGVMEAKVLYEPPFTDIAPQGPNMLFSQDELGGLISIIGSVRDAALVA